MKFFTLVLFFFGFSALQAQTLTLRGHITDSDTEEGIPFANAFIKSLNKGVSADEFGQFVLVLPVLTKPDSITFTAVGYRSTTRVLRDTNFLLIRMSSDETLLNEFVFYAGENPALPIMRGLIANKPKNRLTSIDRWQREEYSKTELDLTNLDNKLKKSKLLKPFEFIFANVDSASDEKPFLPVYVAENLDQVSYNKSGGGLQRLQVARRTSGVENQTANEAIQKLQNDIDIYDNYIYIIDKSFISPFCDEALLFYKYMLLDSAEMDGIKCHKLSFRPRRKGETTFTGECWIADSSFAVVQVRMYMSEDVNINLIDRIIIYQDCNYKDYDRWLPNKQRIVVDFVALAQSPGFIIRRSMSSNKYKIDADTDANIPKPPKYVQQEKLIKDEQFWIDSRHDSLTRTEQQVYKMIDTLQNLPIYQTYVDWIRTLVGGYKEFGYIEIGPYVGLYSRNPVEGNRVSLGIYTSRKFSEKVKFGGYAAYGFRDENWKGGAEVTWLPKRYPRTLIGAKWRHDITSNHENSEILTDASLFSGIYRRPVPFKLMLVDEIKVSFEQYRTKGFSYKVSVVNQNIDPFGGILANEGGFNYAYRPEPFSNPARIDTIVNTTEVVFKLRYAPGEKFYDGVFSRTVLGNRKPAMDLVFSRGFADFGGNYEYHKLTFTYQHWTYLNPFGWISYNVRAGKVWGTVPFLLLEVAPGNETYFFNKSGFNAMNRYEFVADRFLSFGVTHHFEGLLLNHIPLMRKLKWREVAVLRGMWGGLSDSNRRYNELNEFDPTKTDSYMGFRDPFPVPYMETGVGIENIFKVLRFDAVWRLNYVDHPQASRLSLRASFDFQF